MKRTQRVFGDLDALRYVDGRLEEDRKAAFLAHLAEDPAEAERVATWTRQNETIWAAFAGVALESVPPALRLGNIATPRGGFAAATDDARPPAVLKTLPARGPEPRRAPGAEPAAVAYLHRPRSAPRVDRLLRLPLSAALLFGLAMLIVYVAHGLLVQPAAMLETSAPRRTAETTPTLASRAADAFATYALDTLHPVEFTPLQNRDFARWMKHRVGFAVEAADLTAEGWSLLGSRLVPALDGPGAFYVYENRAGDRLGLLVSHALPFATAAVDLSASDTTATMSWSGGSFGYAIAVDKTVDWLSRNGEALKERIAR